MLDNTGPNVQDGAGQIRSDEALHTAAQILKALGAGRAFERVIEFHKPYEPGVDFASSLILLRSSEQRRVRAYLNVSPKLDGLPIIRRTGDSSPWMRGYMLGFESDRVTDPFLQRTGCLFVDAQAAMQEWVDLFTLIFKQISQGAALKPEEISELWQQTLSNNKDWFSHHANWDKLLSPLFEWYIEAGEQGNLHTAGRGELRQRMAELISVLLQQEIKTSVLQDYLTLALHDFEHWADTQSAELPDPELLRNRIIALFLTLGVAPYDRRHLGIGNLKKTVQELARPYNLVVQGAGDLSMNEHNVAFYHDERGEPQVFMPEFEPYSSRRYNCLVAWKHNVDRNEITEALRYIKDEGIGVSLGEDLAITELRFSKSKPEIRFSGTKRDFHIHELASFAVYGKIVLRNGHLVPQEEVIDEFQDLRHVFALPNLNPKPEEIATLLEMTKRVIEGWKTQLLKQPAAERLPEHVSRWLAQLEELARQAKEMELEKEKIELLEKEKTKLKEKIELLEKEKIKLVEKIWHYSTWGQPEFREARQQLELAARNLGKEAASTILFLIANFSELRNLLESPRHFFGLWQHTDVWLLEHALLKEGSLRHLACKAPVAVDLVDLGAPKVWVTFSLLRAGYQEKNKLHEVKEAGDFAWDDSHRLFVHLRWSDYPCTIVGIGSVKQGQACDTLYLFARGHQFKRGKTIWDCAEMLREAGGRYALVMDEGQDVFQGFLPGDVFRTWKQFEEDERSLESLEKWMPVPFAFKEEVLKDENGNEKKVRRLLRRGLRASLVFCQG